MKYLFVLMSFLLVEFVGWYGGVEIFERGESSAFTTIIGIIIGGVILSTYDDIRSIEK